MTNGLDCLGAEEAPRPRKLPTKRLIFALGAGALGALFVPKHRVLGFLNAAALASNIDAVHMKERTWKEAVKRVGRHLVATAASLAMPRHPAIGYVGGAIAADLLIDDEGGGIIEEWSEYEGIRDRDVIDVSFSEEKPSTALVKVDK